MKSRVRIFPIICCMLFVFLLCGSFVRANGILDEIYSESEGELSHCKVLGNDIVCIENYDYSPEIQTIKIHNLMVYRKKITINRKYIKIQNSEMEPIASVKYAVTFTYDKKSAVKAEVEEETPVKASGILKIFIEKLCDDNLAMTSTKYVVCEKGSLNEYKYLMDGHTDISCTSDGEILINSDVR